MSREVSTKRNFIFKYFTSSVQQTRAIHQR